MMNTAADHKNTHAPMLVPWLVFPDSEEGVKRMAFIDVFHRRKKISFRRTPPLVRGKTCVAAMHGWMIMREKDQCCLWNPDTQQIIDLPSLSLDEHDLEDGVWFLVSPPANSDCMVLFVDKTSIHAWKPNDQEWSKHDYELARNGIKEDDHSFNDTFMHLNGNIYALTSRSQVAVIQSGTSGILSARLLNFVMPKIERTHMQEELVESGGELYLVCAYIKGIFKTRAIDHVVVFKMDFTREVFMRVESLGDRVFFISYNGSVSFSAAKLGLQGNCVYITYQKDVHVFHLEDGSLSVYSPFMNPPVPSPFWFVPSNGLLRMCGDGDDENENSTTRQEVKVDHVEEYVGHRLVDLPEEILRLIATCLLPIAYDCMRFRLVCRTFRRSAPPLRLSTQYPLLMFGNRRHVRCSISDPIKNITYCFDLPKLLGAKIRFSKDGWLLMSKDDTSLFFFNPYTQVTVELPDLISPKIVFEVLCFSSPPTSPDCTIFGICQSTFHYVMILCLRLGEDAWTPVHADHDDFFYPSSNCPVFHEGSFYCLGIKGELGVFDAWDLSWKVIPMPMPRPCSSIYQIYLVEWDGELTSVFVGRSGKYVDAYLLDRSKMKWLTLSNLKDQTLFLSPSSSISVKMISEGIRSRIYFPISYDNSLLFYSLETRKWHSAFGSHCREDTYNTRERLHCTWFQPSYQ